MALIGANAHNCAFARQLLFRSNYANVRGKARILGRMIEFAAVNRQSAATLISHRVQ